MGHHEEIRFTGYIILKKKGKAWDTYAMVPVTWLGFHKQRMMIQDVAEKDVGL